MWEGIKMEILLTFLGNFPDMFQKFWLSNLLAGNGEINFKSADIS